jgi:hypothetical protein
MYISFAKYFMKTQYFLVEFAEVLIKPEHQKAIDFYKKNCSSIEIIKNDALQKVNFRVENRVSLINKLQQ